MQMERSQSSTESDSFGQLKKTTDTSCEAAASVAADHQSPTAETTVPVDASSVNDLIGWLKVSADPRPSFGKRIAKWFKKFLPSCYGGSQQKEEDVYVFLLLAYSSN